MGLIKNFITYHILSCSKKTFYDLFYVCFLCKCIKQQSETGMVFISYPKITQEVESEEIHLCWFYIQVKIGSALIYLSYNESAKW